jgi:hypothetical protein
MGVIPLYFVDYIVEALCDDLSSSPLIDYLIIYRVRASALPMGVAPEAMVGYL